MEMNQPTTHATIELVGLDELEVAEHVLADVLDAADWSIEQTEAGSSRNLDEIMWYANRTDDGHGGWREREAGEPTLQKFGKGVLTIRSKALLKEFLYEVRWRSQPADGYVLREAARSIVKKERAWRADR